MNCFLFLQFLGASSCGLRFQDFRKIKRIVDDSAFSSLVYNMNGVDLRTWCRKFPRLKTRVWKRPFQAEKDSGKKE